MKTTITLKKLIESKKFDWTNSDITEDKFPLTEIRGDDYKLFHFDKYISSEDAIKEMEKEGYSACNIFELLSWTGWNDKDTVIALGSVGEVDGRRHIPCLGRNDSKRRLYLYWWNDRWSARDRFLGVRNSSLVPSVSLNPALGNLETFTLERAIEICKENGLTVTKVY